MALGTLSCAEGFAQAPQASQKQGAQA